MTDTIVVITTGGTIGSVLDGSTLRVDESASKLRDQISKISRARHLDFKVIEAINKNSEDIKPADWLSIVEAVRKCISEGVRRIVITHGTDTLAYTAAALGLIFDGSAVRICLTGSFLPVGSPNSDAPLNLVAAIKVVSSDDGLPDGVYVAFRSNKDNTRAEVMHWFDVKPMDADELSFSSLYGRRLGWAYEDRNLSIEMHQVADLKRRREHYPIIDASGLSCLALSEASSRILCSVVYPGFNPHSINLENLDAIVLSLYHSGTAPSNGGKNSLTEFIAAANEKVLIVGATWPSENLTDPYESTVQLMKAGALIFKEFQPHTLYVFLLLSLAKAQKVNESISNLSYWQYVEVSVVGN